MHKLLERQLKKIYGGLERVPEALRSLLPTVDATYEQSDADRLLLERSLDLTSQELLAANIELRRDRKALELRVEERAADLLRVNASLEREISERREAETALRQSERRYQILAYNSPAGILQSDAEGECLYVNNKWCEMAGITPKEALADGWLDGLHAEDRQRVAGEWRRAVSGRLPMFSTEFRFERPDSAIFWVVGQAVALRGDDNRPAGYVLTATDITVRKTAEEKILKSEEKYRSLFEDSRDMIYISSPDGELLDVNPAGVALFGYSSTEELLAADLRDSFPAHRRDRLRMLDLLEEQGFVKDLEIEVRRKDGVILTVLATATPVCDASGRIVALRGLLRDVTEQRELEHRLLQAQKMEAVGRLAGGVAHDFNNLLTAILGYTELVRSTLEVDSASLRHIEEIELAAKRGARLTQQLLAFSRRQVLEPQVLGLNQVVGDMESLLRRIIGEDIELVTRFATDLGPVQADCNQIEQVLLNLAVNARDAMPEGGRLELETFNVAVRPGDSRDRMGLEPGRYTALVVADSGVGIDEEIRDRIFEPFFTTKDGGRGTGLGLSTVYGIVQQTGGRIDVSSRQGRGSRFEILLPQVAAKPEEPAEERPIEGIPAGTETILLAEDEPAVRSFLDLFLRKQGYKVLTAADGQEALEIARDSRHRIALLLSDVVMPKLNGLELARRIRTSEPDLKVILMSGHTGTRTGARDLDGLEVEFLQKPFSTKDLGRKLREMLEPASPGV